jgi:hypothetical protein
MLPKHFFRKLKGYNKAIQQRQRSEWERTRWATCVIVNLMTSGNKKIKLTDLFQFEDEKQSKEINFEKLKARAEFIKHMEDFKLKEKGKDGK